MKMRKMQKMIEQASPATRKEAVQRQMKWQQQLKQSSMTSYDIFVNRETISNLCTCTFKQNDLSCLLLLCMYVFFFSWQKYLFVYFDGNTLFYTFQATFLKKHLETKHFFFIKKC